MSSPLKKRTLREWWDGFCDSLSHAWDSFKVKAHLVTRPMVTVNEMNGSFTENAFDDDSSSGVETVRTSTAKRELFSSPPHSPVVKEENEAHYSSFTLASVQQSESDKLAAEPAKMYKTGLAFLAVSGVLSLAAAFSGIYPIFAIAGMLAVLSAALIFTAYMLNDEKKNGTLTSQVFPADSQKSFVPA